MAYSLGTLIKEGNNKFIRSCVNVSKCDVQYAVNAFMLNKNVLPAWVHVHVLQNLWLLQLEPYSVAA